MATANIDDFRAKHDRLAQFIELAKTDAGARELGILAANMLTGRDESFYLAFDAFLYSCFIGNDQDEDCENAAMMARQLEGYRPTQESLLEGPQPAATEAAFTMQHKFPAGAVATKFELIGFLDGSDRGELLAAAPDGDTLWDCAIEGPREWIQTEAFDDYYVVMPGGSRPIDAYTTKRTVFFTTMHKEHTEQRLIEMLGLVKGLRSDEVSA